MFVGVRIQSVLVFPQLSTVVDELSYLAFKTAKRVTTLTSP